VGKISGRTLYTAEEYLKMPEYKITGKLKREIEEIEERNKKPKKIKKKSLKVEQVIKKLLEDRTISVEEKDDYTVIKKKDKVIYWVAERKKWIAVSSWKKGGIDFKTVKLFNDKDLEDFIKESKDVSTRSEN